MNTLKAIATLLLISSINLCLAQDENYNYKAANSLSGPRLGITYLTGNTASFIKETYDANPIITQFGWQIEWRFFTIDKGPTGVVEFVPLLGGLEQGLFLPSISVPVGLRAQSGFEFGVGPNVSLAGFSIALAVGYTFKTGELNWPINFSLVPSKEGYRFSFLFGFNMIKN